jgi:hypothetical protein
MNYICPLNLNKPMKKIILSVAIIATAFLVSCGGGSSDPKAVAKSYLEAQQKADYTTAKKYCTEETKNFLDMISTLGSTVPDSIKKAAANAKFTYQDAKIDGDKATVGYSVSDKPGDQTLNLVKKDGKWLVAQSKDTNAPEGAMPETEVPAATKEEAVPAAKH